jgi:hypothetical protein
VWESTDTLPCAKMVGRSALGPTGSGDHLENVFPELNRTNNPNHSTVPCIYDRPESNKTTMNYIPSGRHSRDDKRPKANRGKNNIQDLNNTVLVFRDCVLRRDHHLDSGRCSKKLLTRRETAHWHHLVLVLIHPHMAYVQVHVLDLFGTPPPPLYAVVVL